MEKNDVMLEYEKLTGKPSINRVTDGIHCVYIDVWHYEFINWLLNFYRTHKDNK